MFKTKKDFLWSVGPIAIIALLVFTLNKVNQPKEVILEIKASGKSKEHEFVAGVLDDTEAVVEEEDARLNAVEKEAISMSPVSFSEGRSHSGYWERVSAPSINEVELSPSLERSLAASASLATEEFSNPNSEMNLERASNLREIRKQRAEQTQN